MTPTYIPPTRVARSPPFGALFFPVVLWALIVSIGWWCGRQALLHGASNPALWGGTAAGALGALCLGRWASRHSVRGSPTAHPQAAAGWLVGAAMVVLCLGLACWTAPGAPVASGGEYAAAFIHAWNTANSQFVVLGILGLVAWAAGGMAHQWLGYGREGAQLPTWASMLLAGLMALNFAHLGWNYEMANAQARAQRDNPAAIARPTDWLALSARVDAVIEKYRTHQIGDRTLFAGLAKAEAQRRAGLRNPDPIVQAVAPPSFLPTRRRWCEWKMTKAYRPGVYHCGGLASGTDLIDHPETLPSVYDPLADQTVRFPIEG